MIWAYVNYLDATARDLLFKLAFEKAQEWYQLGDETSREYPSKPTMQLHPVREPQETTV